MSGKAIIDQEPLFLYADGTGKVSISDCLTEGYVGSEIAMIRRQFRNGEEHLVISPSNEEEAFTILNGELLVDSEVFIANESSLTVGFKKDYQDFDISIVYRVRKSAYGVIIGLSMIVISFFFSTYKMVHHYNQTLGYAEYAINNNEFGLARSWLDDVKNQKEQSTILQTLLRKDSTVEAHLIDQFYTSGVSLNLNDCDENWNRIFLDNEETMEILDLVCEDEIGDLIDYVLNIDIANFGEANTRIEEVKQRIKDVIKKIEKRKKDYAENEKTYNEINDVLTRMDKMILPIRKLFKNRKVYLSSKKESEEREKKYREDCWYIFNEFLKIYEHKLNENSKKSLK